MILIKVKFIKDNKPAGREYTYYSNELVKPGDRVQINSSAVGVVTCNKVDESEIEAFKDKVKTIIGKVEAEE